MSDFYGSDTGVYDSADNWTNDITGPGAGYTDSTTNAGGIDTYGYLFNDPIGGMTDSSGSVLSGYLGAGSVSGPGGSAAALGSGWVDSIWKWATEGTGSGGKQPSILAMAMPDLVKVGFGAVGEAITGSKKQAQKLAEQRVAIEQQNANTNAAHVARTSYGNSMPTFKPPAGGLINFHPVTINRAKSGVV